MSTELFIGMGSALWLGILTSISPCPLATNVAAISFIGKRLDSRRAVVVTGLLYTLGRSLVYVALGAILVVSVLSAPNVSQFLQRYMNRFLGPLLILIGMLLLGLLRLPLPNTGASEKLGRKVEPWGVWGGLVLGVIFALSFCPVSAGLFFGSLLAVAVKHESPILMPSLYGIGTALPVIVFAILLAVSTGAMGKAYGGVTQSERWARLATGILFIGIGVYYSLAFVFRVV